MAGGHVFITLESMAMVPGVSLQDERQDGLTSRIDGPLGAVRALDGTCSFLLWAPRAKQVEVVLLSPDRRTIPMQPAARGYFTVTAENIPAGSLYFYRLDGNNERPDPVSRFQPRGVHGPSQVIDTHFDWSDSTWRGIPLQKYVLYELHVGTFTPEGTFDAVIPRIAALKELGVTAIEIMPVAQFPGGRNWGYDGVYQFAVQDTYGGPTGLKRLVNACHQQGMAVVLDVVYNHFGPEGNYISEFAPYFTPDYHTPWGDALNFDGPHSDDVRRYFFENALQWINDFHFDALRLDAVHAVIDPSARNFLEELGITCRAAAEMRHCAFFLIAESNRNDPRIVSKREVGGRELDAEWNDDFHHALHFVLTGEQNGYYEDFSEVGDLARAVRDGFVYTGQFSKFRQKRYGRSSKEIPGERFVVFSQNHDQVGNRMRGDRLSETLPSEQLRLAAGIVLLSPCIPLLFMGEEYGEVAPFQYFVSHGDAGLIDAVRRGRAAEFEAFRWAGELPDPQDEQTFIRSRLNWDLQKTEKHRQLHSFYKELLRLRSTIPALAHLDKNSQEVVCVESSKTILVRRWRGASQVFAAFHFGDGPADISFTVPAGRWRKELDSSDKKWGAEGSGVPDLFVSNGELKLSLGPWAFVVFIQTEAAQV
jgi:maltooligosyltrehalose trehalohydrolase